MSWVSCDPKSTIKTFSLIVAGTYRLGGSESSLPRRKKKFHQTRGPFNRGVSLSGRGFQAATAASLCRLRSATGKRCLSIG
jgi:hypothetical protein